MLIKSMVETQGENKRTYRKLANSLAKYEIAIVTIGLTYMLVVCSRFTDIGYGRILICALYGIFATLVIKSRVSFIRIEDLNIQDKSYIRITEYIGRNKTACFCVSRQSALPVGRKGKTVYLAANTTEFVGDESGEYAITFNFRISAKRFLKDLKKRYYAYEILHN